MVWWFKYFTLVSCTNEKTMARPLKYKSGSTTYSVRIPIINPEYYREQIRLLVKKLAKDRGEIINRLTEVKNLRIADVSGSLPCHHNYIQKDTYWISCTHCGMIAPLGQ